MPGFEREIHLAHEPAAVWAVLTSGARAPEWLPDVVSVEQLTPGPLGVGTKLRETRRSGRKKIAAEHVVTAWEPERVYAVAVEQSGLRGSYRYELEPADGGGTRVVWRAEVVGRGLYRLMQGTVARLMEKRDGDRLERLRGVLETVPVE